MPNSGQTPNALLLEKRAEVSMKNSPRPPGPSLFEFFPILSALRNDPLYAFIHLNRRYGDIIFFPLGNFRAFAINDPKDIQHVLKGNPQNYLKSKNYDKMKPLLGTGLLTSENDFWRKQRRIAQPIFHQKRIEALSVKMIAATQDMLERWKSVCKSGETLDVAVEMMRLTLDIVGRTLFSIDINDKAAGIAQSLRICLHQINKKVVSLVPMPQWVPTPGNLRFRKAIDYLNTLVFDIIQKNRQEVTQGNDLLSMLLRARDEESGESMSDQQLRDEVMTIILAGHETTANALSWTFYLLSKNPAAAKKLKSEVTDVLGSRLPTFHDLTQMPYTKMVLEESLRLYPPAWIIERNSIAEDELGGYRVPPNTMIFMCTYLTHRHPKYWENPEGFDPERFHPEKSLERDRFAYFPFGGGPRQCIGSQFALTEAQLILAMVTQKFRLDLIPGQQVFPEAKVTLRPRDGVLMTLHEAK